MFFTLSASKTPVAKVEITDISSTSNESSLASKSFTQRHRQMSSVTALSARVPRIAKAFQQKQGPSTAFRDVRVLQEVDDFYDLSFCGILDISCITENAVLVFSLNNKEGRCAFYSQSS